MFGTSVPSAMMEQSINGIWQRTQTTLNNIANESTPGYKAKRVEFESLLRKEVNARTNVTAFGRDELVSRINGVQPIEYEDRSTVGRADGNNVDVTSENIELSRLQIQMNALTQKLSGHYSILKYAVTGGR